MEVSPPDVWRRGMHLPRYYFNEKGEIVLVWYNNLHDGREKVSDSRGDSAPCGGGPGTDNIQKDGKKSS